MPLLLTTEEVEPLLEFSKAIDREIIYVEAVVTGLE